MGTAISERKGQVFIETLRGTTNSQDLTSTGVNAEDTDRCYFSAPDTISILPRYLPLTHAEQIRDICQFFPGYYEFVFGCSGKKER